MVLGTLSSTTPCFSQVTVSHLDICGGFSRPDGACQRNLLSRREKVTDVSRPKGKLAAHHQTTHAPSSLPFLPHLLKFLYVYNACGIWKRQGRPHEGTRAMARRTAQLSTVNCLADNFLLQGVEHFSETQVSG